MILSEFKAWFEGFTEGLEGPPTKAQFDRMKAKVADITGTPVTYPVYVDRYIETLRPYYRQYPWAAGVPFWGTVSGGYAVGALVQGTVNNNMTGAQGTGQSDAKSYQLAAGAPNSFDSHSAMHALGKAEAAIN